MKLNTALAIATVLGTAALPLASQAQSSPFGRGNSQNHRNDDRYDNRRNDSRRNDNRYNDRRNDNRWNSSSREADRRQDTKNEWRNIAIGSGALGLLGLLTKDNTLTFGGAAGALYSLTRYEQDRKSQNRYDRTRSSYFDRDHFYRDGVRFDRRTVTKNGQRYYQFFRSR
ncbi:MAG: hypothetical protein ACO1SV_26365 [Fimbriimonas sp.]